ncbi:MAG: FGGY-family carbohydrate kinase [Sphaerochaetaceae bacterium]
MILAIDVGTTTFKGALVDAKGQLNHLKKYPLEIVNGVEINPLQWEKALAELCRTLAPKAKIRAVVVSGNGPTVVPVLGEREVRQGVVTTNSANALLWLDKRSQEEAAELSEILESFLDASFFLPKILRLMRNDSALYRRVRTFLPTSDYINYLLSGQKRATLHARDGEKWYWTQERVAKVGLDWGKFPPLILPKEIVGRVDSLAAEALALEENLPVIAGGPDFIATILGSGATEEQMVCNRSGTSEGVNLCSSNPIYDNRLLTYAHPVEPYYNISGVISTSGKAISWIQELLKITELNQLYTLAEKSAPASGGLIFLPYLSGERSPIWDANARGVFFGLSLQTNREQIARAVIEGVALALRDVIEVMESLGTKVSTIRVTGGPSESTFLNQLKADVTGRRLEVPLCREAELIGDAIIGYTALGVYPSFAQAAQTMVKVGESFTGNPANYQVYGEVFRAYRSLYTALKGEWRRKNGNRH